MKPKLLPAKRAKKGTRISALIDRVNAASTPSRSEINQLRNLAARTKGALTFDNSVSQAIRQQLIEKISAGVRQAYLLAEIDKLNTDLGYDNSPPLDRILIDHILTARIRLIYAEITYNAKVVFGSFTREGYDLWDTLLSRAQHRYLRAVETLARVRRLAQNTPSMQINIAQDGGKQVNLQSDHTERHPRGHSP